MATVTLPLADDAIPRVRLSETDIERYRHLTTSAVDSTLVDEMAFRSKGAEWPDAAQWKLVKGKDQMRVFKRVEPSSKELASVLLGVGVIDGTVEDTLFGLHHKTTLEMRATSAFINKDILDVAVLHNIETGTDDDPFRYLGLKWRAAHTPGPGVLIKDRDVCNIECMGMRTDASGAVYGYQMLKSVDAPGVPVFSEAVLVRAQMMLCCIFRQLTPTTVAFYSKGSFNLCGDLADFISYNTSADMLLSISKAVDCAAAKRLTLMVLQTEAITASTAPFVRRQSSLKLLASEHEVFKGAFCALCARKPSMLSSPCRPCKLCAAPVCSRCSIKTHLIARPQCVRIVCCHTCVRKSKSIHIDPRTPYPVILLHDGV